MLGDSAKSGRVLPTLAAAAFTLMISGLLLGASTRGAYAYLDAGTGSMILQVLLGGFAGIALVGKLYWHRLLVLLRIREDVPEDEETGEARARSEAQAGR